ncbi:MAG: hypothetical protein ACI4JB_07865 [Porcipelethomonas sp.]
MLWIILGSILLLLIFLMLSPVKIYVTYIDNKPEAVLKYLFFRKKLNGAGKKLRKAEKAETGSDTGQSEEDRKAKRKKSFIPESTSGKIEFIKNLASSGGRAFRRITKHIKIKGIFIDIQISDMDAYECALKFGKANIVVYNLFSYLGNFVKLKKKSINIKCVYNQPESIYNISFNVRLTPAAAVMTAAAFAVRFLLDLRKSAGQKCQTA